MSNASTPSGDGDVGAREDEPPSTDFANLNSAESCFDTNTEMEYTPIIIEKKAMRQENSSGKITTAYYQL